MSSIQNKIYRAPGAHQLFMYPANISQGEGCMIHRRSLKKNKNESPTQHQVFRAAPWEGKAEKKKGKQLII
jgi:hypothetical protein